ncbi:MAG: thiosulfate oxidation carrier protein SoxY [Rhodospirillales bacterium]|nr:thiosulfate oxidation carrier protein SoxY [Rhodospirillales bacterium]
MTISKATETPSRRQVLITLATGSFALATITALPRWAKADTAAVDAATKELIGDATPSEGRITLDLPQIAENGNTVPLTVEVDSPMSEADYCKAVHVFAEGNPLPNVASFRFTPACGQAFASTRIRLAKTQNVIAVAEMSNGSVYTAKAEVKVTIGGCGG